MEALDYLHDLVPMNTTSSRSNLPAADYVEEALKRLDFETERIEYDDANGVRKASILGKRGEGQGGMAYFGHTDTVPADTWFTDEYGPFEPTVKGDRLYGRGSCDMKGSISCMLAAAGRLSGSRLREPPLHHADVRRGDRLRRGGRRGPRVPILSRNGHRGDPWRHRRAHHAGSGLRPQGHLRVHRHLPWKGGPFQQPRGAQRQFGHGFPSSPR